MPKQVTFIISDDTHRRANVFFDDKHLGYEASKALEERLKRLESRARRAERERGGE